ncbi:hypothetical protein AB0L62_21980 [Nocardia asteroides]|uniref:hypothetical protein n=1 Tax=Nocardia asteroides TaxID=1824 RepID=UPI003425CD2B
MRAVHPIPSRFGLERGYRLGLASIATGDGSRRVAVAVSQGTVDADDPAKFSQYMTAAYTVTAMVLCGSTPQHRPSADSPHSRVRAGRG